MFIDDVRMVVMIGVRCENTAAYTLREAERIAFGEAVQRGATVGHTNNYP